MNALVEETDIFLDVGPELTAQGRCEKQSYSRGPWSYSYYLIMYRFEDII